MVDWVADARPPLFPDHGSAPSRAIAKPQQALKHLRNVGFHSSTQPTLKDLSFGRYFAGYHPNFQRIDGMFL
jgi:hypothetical protein